MKKYKRKTTCPICENVFFNKRIGTKYCSRKCYQIQWAKNHIGKSPSIETRRKIGLANSIALKGNIPWNKGKKGYTTAAKGRKNIWIIGKNNSNWKGGVTSKNNMARANFRKTIQKVVFKRDNYTCQICGIRNGQGKTVRLQVDHIQSWAEYVEQRFNIDNCRTLCQKCHYQITFGKPMPPEVKTWGHNFKYV